jgi:hypothetical protein
VPRVEHHAELPARPQNSDGFADRAPRVRRVVEDAPGVDPVEALVLKRQLLCVGLPYLGLEPFELQPAPDQLDCSVGQVDAGCKGAGARETEEVRAETDTNLEDLLSSCALEIGEAGDVRLELDAPELDLLEELR